MRPLKNAIRSLVIIFIFLPVSVLAAEDETSVTEGVFTGGIVFTGVGEDCQERGECSLEDTLQVFVNISNFVLGISGSLALALLIYGGLRWLTSQGDPESVKAGRKAMTGAVVGLFIVFGAFTLINVVTSVLRGGTVAQVNKCELVSPEEGGKAGLGYACVNVNTRGSSEGCEANLCPGGSEIMCCPSGSE